MMRLTLAAPCSGLYFVWTAVLLAILISTPLILELHNRFGCILHAELELYGNEIDLLLQEEKISHAVDHGKEIDTNESLTWKDGCIDWSPRTKSGPVSGLAVTLLLNDGNDTVDQRRYLEKVCKDFVPSQLSHFLEPHGIDLLFVVSGSKFIYDSVIRCLNLSEHDKEETWTNLDGTILTTKRHRSLNNRTYIYFANDYRIKLPSYMKDDRSLFSSNAIEPPFCAAPLNYISGTRWYSNEMLHLGILQNYDYWVKLDLDVLFLRTIPIHLLQNIHRKGAVFAHTAEYGEAGSQTCTRGSRQAVQNFVNSTKMRSWKNCMCSEGYTTLERDTDQYYTNFVIGSVPFWQSQPVLQFARYLSEYSPGFFKYRWTDQVFYHNAMGLFLPSFKQHVLDYTGLRCSPRTDCWVSSLDMKQFGPRAQFRCDNNGYFVHVKSAAKLSGAWKDTVSNVMLSQSSKVMYNHTYQYNCTYNLDYDS